MPNHHTIGGMSCWRKNKKSKYQPMDFEESRWRQPSLLWILIVLSGGLLFFINVFQMQYNNIVEPTVVFESTLEILPSEDIDTKDFLVKTKGCRISEMKAFDPSINQFIFQEKPVVCNEGIPPLVESNLTSLFVLSSSFAAYDVNDTGLLRCCYSAFKRANPVNNEKDGKVEYDKNCIHFNDSVDIHEEFVIVRCTYNASMIYRDFFSFVPIKSIVRDSNDVKEKLNVLIVGIDSISRLNFHRQMPKTLAVLQELKAVELLGYNKVGDNTFPNLIPILTGLNEDELKRKCWPNTTAYFDDCPFVWKRFSKSAYATTFAEDASWMGIFNYQKRGFKHQPTDYYWDTFDTEAEKQIGNSHKVNVHQCVGARESYRILIDYAYKFAKTLTVERRPYFGFFWSSSLSHDLLNKPKLGDGFFEAFIRRLQNENLLENTVFIFLSDHGMRWGEIRSTFQGRIEERLPFIHIYLPKRYKEEYSMAYSNLVRNSRRLTTPYDLHETLVDLIDPHALTKYYLFSRQRNKTTRRAYSLFETISTGRTCEDAFISSHWCTCQESIKIKSDDPVVLEAANFTVDFINRLLVGYADCVVLELDEVVDSHLQTHHENIIKQHTDQDYTLTLRTKPSGALFEATVRRKHHENEYNYEIIGTISRINLYGKQSLCIMDFHLKLYCFCKHLL